MLSIVNIIHYQTKKYGQTYYPLIKDSLQFKPVVYKTKVVHLLTSKPSTFISSLYISYKFLFQNKI